MAPVAALADGLAVEHGAFRSQQRLQVRIPVATATSIHTQSQMLRLPFLQVPPLLEPVDPVDPSLS